MMKTFVVLLLLFVTKGSWAAASPYKLKQSQDAVSLVQVATGRVVWTQKGTGFTPLWSVNHRAVALQLGNGFLLWREGGKRVSIPNPAIPGSDGKDHYDYSMGGVWSPDNRRFLARYGVSGMADMGPTGWGRVFCFNLRRDGSYKSHVMPYADYATKLAWRDNKTALYWTLNERTGQPNRNPRRWRVP